MTVGLARRNGFGVDEQTAAQQVKTNVEYIEQRRDSLHQGFFSAQVGAEAVADLFGPSVLSYILVGLDAEHYKPDLNTDAVAMYLKSRQMADGHWAYGSGDGRPPICLDYVAVSKRTVRDLGVVPAIGYKMPGPLVEALARPDMKDASRILHTWADRSNGDGGLRWNFCFG